MVRKTRCMRRSAEGTSGSVHRVLTRPLLSRPIYDRLNLIALNLPRLPRNTRD